MLIICSQCDHWYKLSGSVIGKCRCKQSENWNQTVLYCNTCQCAEKIKVPMFLENVARVKA